MVTLTKPTWEKIEWLEAIVPRQIYGKSLGYAPLRRWDSFPSFSLISVIQVMWSLITGKMPPMPPRPVFPRNKRSWIRETTTRAQFQEILDYHGYKGPISYCHHLFDDMGSPNDRYGDVDDDLRDTLYKCMFHRPADRPTLKALLDQAKLKIVPGAFPSEDDDMILEWVRRWFYDAPIPPTPPPAPRLPPFRGLTKSPPGSRFGDASGLSDFESSSQGSGGSGGGPPGGPPGPTAPTAALGPTIWLTIRYNAAFPYRGLYQRVHNAAPGNQCGRE
jgi:serine/threonine protein kinase